MQIIGSQTSPYVRITRALAYELNLSHEFVKIGTILKPTDEEKQLVEDNNPLIKIPVLKDEENTVFDSRVICNHLINKAKNQGAENPFGDNLSVQQENIITVALGICESAVIRIIFSLTTDLNPDEGYLQHSLKRIAKSLDYLDSQEDLGQEFGLPELTLICTLDFLEKRNIIEWRKYKNIEKIYESYKNQPSLVKTSIPSDT